MLKEAQIAKLLNRSLTTAETTNYDLYLKIAMQRLEELLCIDLCGEAGERTYQTRTGYRTLYIDPFTEVNSVSIDGNAVTDYVVKQNDKFNGTWYNIIEFDRRQLSDLVVVDAEWGFDSVPVDLQLLLAQLFNQGSIEQTNDHTVKSKKIEDFSVTYKDSATYDEFVNTNSAVIGKYSQCDVGAIRHGSVSGYDYIQPLYNY